MNESFRLTLQQTGVIVAAALGMLMLPLAPLNGRFSGSCVVTFILLAFLTRNIVVIGVTAAVFNLLERLFVQVSSWHDQHWVQWSSVSSLLTGHNIFDTSPLYNFSLSSYMPSGDLFGGVFIALGIHQYWQVWHVIVVCLIGLPLVLSPSFITLLFFVVFSAFYPFCDYTTGGGTLEIAYALSIGGIAMFRTVGLRTPSLAVFAFAGMFRQPMAMVLPFLFLILWRDRDYRRMKILGLLLVLFGGLFIALNPGGAYRYLYQVWEGYHQEIFNVTPGLSSNYSISALPHALGVSDVVNWYEWKPFYSLMSVLGLVGLFVIARFRKQPEEVLLLGFLASASVYILSRGYAQFGYTATAFFPLAAFAYPLGGRCSAGGRNFARGLALVLLWVGLLPSVLYAGALIVRKAGEFRPPAVTHALNTIETQSATLSRPLPALDGEDANAHIFPLSSTVEFQVPTGIYSAVTLSCNHTPVVMIKGVQMPYPTDVQMRGAITSGVLETSEDGVSYSRSRTFHNAVNYCIWPVSIPLPRSERPISFVRLKAEKLYLDQKEWILGNVEFVSK